MAALDDLKTAVADLGTSIGNELDAISVKVSNLPSGGGTSDADIEAVVQQIDALKTKIDDETSLLSGGQTGTPGAPTTTPVS